jgi:glycosyltransferase involved in cell wall biosynthesis
MKILWLATVIFPPLAEHLNVKIPNKCGWLYSAAKNLLYNTDEIKLGVVIPMHGISGARKIILEKIIYYIIPAPPIDSYNKRNVLDCKYAMEDFKPNLIHIYGSEKAVSAAMCEANDGIYKTLVNIQGLASGIVPYADGGISWWDKLTNLTPLDFYKGTYLLNVKRKFLYRAECEDYVIKHVTDIVGRTQWDHDHALTLNPNIRYHYMNETLRDSFYEYPIWSYEKCKKHTIFVSSSEEPLKGAHQVLKALPIILRQYPDTVVNFCGSNVMSSEWRNLIRLQGYHLYLRKLVKKHGLQQHVNFLGPLTEQQMKQAFLDAHVYLMPSAIENSPNSLCEAQILGVPIVASYCGGTPTLVEDGKTGFLYRYEEIEMLAQQIIRMFEKTDFSTLSNLEHTVALVRHDRNTNACRQIEIYKEILKA